MRVEFLVDYVGRFGSAKNGSIRNISDVAFMELHAKGYVKQHKEKKQTKERKLNLETK